MNQCQELGRLTTCGTPPPLDKVMNASGYFLKKINSILKVCTFVLSNQNIISLKRNLNDVYIPDHFMNEVTTDNLF